MAPSQHSQSELRPPPDGPGSGAGAEFGRSSAVVLRGLRASLIEMLADLGLADVRPAALSAELGVDKTLAWKVSRFTRETNALASFKHLPGQAGIGIMVEAARARGAGDSSLAAVNEAIERLETLVREHGGGSRSTFQSLIGHHAASDGESPAPIGIESRRKLFRSLAAVWGVQAQAQILTAVVRPNEGDPSQIDVSSLSGFVDLQRLRPELPWIIRRMRYSRDDQDASWLPERMALDSGVDAASGPPFVRRFCTSPLPAIHRFDAPDGFVYDELCPGAVGKTGAATCVMGEVVQRVGSHRWSPTNRRGTYTLTVRTPVETVLFDLLIHKAMAFEGVPRLSVHSQFEGRPRLDIELDDATRLDVGGDVEALGAPPVLACRRVPAFGDMTRYACEQAGWDLRDFVGFRLELEYPPAPCDVVLVYDLKKPAGAE